jgi:hypothetical protein
MPTPGLGPYGAVYTHAGVVHSSSLAELKHANGANDPVTIQVFLWAEDVKLSLPTSAVQGFDPNVANRTFETKGRTEYLPDFLGDLSTPGSDGVVDRLEVGSSLLNTSSNTVGISDSNEDAIKTLAMREAWLDSFIWPVNAPAETPLWSARVTPQYFRYQRTDPAILGARGPLTAIPSPSAYSAMPFGYWRGSMRYRLQIVASNMHRGRIRIVYDPVADFLMTDDIAAYPEDLLNVQYSRTIDIGGEAGRDFTFDVGYMQQSPYLPLVPIPVSASGESDSGFDLMTRNFGTPEFTPGYTPLNSSAIPNSFTNGVFTVYVLNRLAVPADTVGLNTDVRINVFASCGPDIDFQQPTTRDLNRISFTDPTGFPPNFRTDPVPISVGALSVRSARTFEAKMDSAAMGTTEDENVPTDPPLMAEFGDTVQPPAPMSSIVFGESMTSWWQLMSRWSLYNREIFCRSDADTGQPREGVDRHMVVAPNFPPYPGPSPIQAKWRSLLSTGVLNKSIVPTSTFQKGAIWTRNGTSVPPPAKFTLNAPLTGDVSGDYDPAAENLDFLLRTNPGNLTMLHFVTRLFVARKGSLRNKYVLAGSDPSAGVDKSGNTLLTVKRLPDSGVISGRTIVGNDLTLSYDTPEQANKTLHYFPASGGLWDQAHCSYGLSTVPVSGSIDLLTTSLSTCQSVNGGVSGVNPCTAPDWCNVTAYPAPWTTVPSSDLHQPGHYASDVLLQNTYDGAHTNVSRLNPVVEVEIPFYANTRFELNELVFTNTTATQAHAIMWDQVRPNRSRPQAEAAFLERYTIPGGDFALYYLANAPLLCLNNALRYVSATTGAAIPAPGLELVDYSTLKYLNGGRQEFCAFRQPAPGTGAFNSSLSRVYFYDIPEGSQDAGSVRTDGTLFPAGVGNV